jgi:hypothetical protein
MAREGNKFFLFTMKEEKYNVWWKRVMSQNTGEEVKNDS